MSSWGKFWRKDTKRPKKKKKIPTATFKVVVIQLLSQIDNLGLTLCDPMDFSTPGSSVLDHLSQSQLKSMSIESVMLSISFGAIPFSCLQSSPASGSFPTSWLFAPSGQTIETSASASVLLVNIQDWFPLWLVWSPGSPRDSQESSLVSQFESISSSTLSLLYVPTLTSAHDYWKNCSFGWS